MSQQFSASQLRAARALLDWSRADLAEQSGVSEPTLHRFENNMGEPEIRTQKKLLRVFETKGVEFIENDGVRKASGSLTTLEGFNDFKLFMDQVYEAAMNSYSHDGTKSICVCNVDNDIFRKHLKDYYFVHLQRMKKLEGIKIRILAPDIDKKQPPDVHYLKYRYLKEMRSTVAPFYVFGDKFALIDFSVPNPPKILLVCSASFAKSYRDQFDIMWKNASDKPLA